MFAVTVSFHVKPEHMERFLPLMTENARTSLRTEPGCRQFDVCTDPGQPGLVFLYELYETAAAFEDHLQSAHFAAFNAATEGMVATKAIATFPEVRQ